MCSEPAVLAGGVSVRVDHRCGVTLVELLVAMAITLIMMFAVVRVFEMIAGGMNDGRAAIEMAGQLRNVAARLQTDLDNATATMLPPVQPESAQGYFEYVEGPMRDGSTPAFPNGDSVIGDVDDILMFTARGRGAPYVGKLKGTLSPAPAGSTYKFKFNPDPNPSSSVYTTIESQVAEIVWWTHIIDNPDGGVPGQKDSQDLIFTHRRVLLVRPDIDISSVTYASNEDIDAFRQANDFSARFRNGKAHANTLADLADRAARFAHDPLDTFNSVRQAWILKQTQQGVYAGDDIVLPRVLAFDVRAYDPLAPVVESQGTTADGQRIALEPGDPNYPPAAGLATAKLLGRGAYVDLNYAGDTGSATNTNVYVHPFEWSPDRWRISYFSGQPHRMSGMDTMTYGETYDTWSTGYLLPEAKDGLDANNAGGVDDVSEVVADPSYPMPVPPYAVPLRGIQVRIRIIEPDSRKVSQRTVTGDFVLE